MTNRTPCGILATVFLAATCAFAQEAKTPPQQASAGGGSDLSSLKTVDVDLVLKNGVNNKKADPQDVIKEADARIAAIKARKGYTAADLDMLTSPWVRTKEFVELIRQGRPLPEVKLAFRGQRNGVFDTGGTAVFKGDAKRGVEILREIGLRDTANGKSWSDMWEIMERTPTVLGARPNGDILYRVDVVVGVNKWFDFVYKQILNVRDIERYAEYDLGGGAYVVVQDLVRDDSAGAEPRAPYRKKRPAKPYFPIKEQISITIIRDNKDGTFTLGTFMSTHGQELKATGGAAIFEIFVDLLKEMEKDTVKNREKWNDLFQKEISK